MTLNLYEGKQRQDSRFLVAVIIANATFAASFAFWCTFVALFASEPIRWATWQGVGSRPELFDYPFCLLWLLPVSGICGAWLAEKAEKRRVAYFLALFPLLFMSLLFCWYYVVPMEWR